MLNNNLTSPLTTDRLFSYDQALNRSPIDDLRPSALAPKRTLERIACNLVIVGFLSLATIVGVAELPVVPEECRRILLSLGAPIGMKQAWRVFSPALRTTNFHTLCLIEFKDGTIKAVEFARMDKLSLIERFIHFKQRNILGDRIANPYYKHFRPTIARYYGRANFSNTGEPDNAPVRVTFVFASAPTPPVHSSHWVYRDQLPEHTFKQVYFSYQVKAEDLSN